MRNGKPLVVLVNRPHETAFEPIILRGVIGELEQAGLEVEVPPNPISHAPYDIRNVLDQAEAVVAFHGSLMYPQGTLAYAQGRGVRTALVGQGLQPGREAPWVDDQLSNVAQVARWAADAVTRCRLILSHHIRAAIITNKGLVELEAGIPHSDSPSKVGHCPVLLRAGESYVFCQPLVSAEGVQGMRNVLDSVDAARDSRRPRKRGRPA